MYARARGPGRQADLREDRCRACQDTGWTWWAPKTETKGKWIICRECIGTGRSDQKGRKRQKPADPPDG